MSRRTACSPSMCECARMGLRRSRTAANSLGARRPERKKMNSVETIPGSSSRFLVREGRGRRGGDDGGHRSALGGLSRRRCATASSARVRLGKKQRERGNMWDASELRESSLGFVAFLSSSSCTAADGRHGQRASWCGPSSELGRYRKRMKILQKAPYLSLKSSVSIAFLIPF